jgi:hypothetical protein
MTRRKRAIEGSGIGRNLTAGAAAATTLALAGSRPTAFATVRRSMRRFATWTTGHRKTVILGWIVALIGFGMLASSAGSDFSEEFSLPSSDSKDALDLLEDRFPAQAGDVVQIVYKAESGVESPAIERKMEGVFAQVAALPQVSEVSSPYEEGGAGAVSENGKIAYATAQLNVTTDKLNDGEVKKIMDTAQAAGGDGLRVETGGSPVEEVRGEEEEGSSEGIGILAAVVVLLISFGSVVAMGLPILTALFALGVGISGITLFTHVFNTAEFAPQLAFMIGLGVGVDYALFILTRFRNGLDEGLDKREAAIAAVDTAGAGGALRRDHGDHLADGNAAARPPLPLRGGDGGGDRGAVHDDRGAHPAAGDAVARRRLGQPAAHSAPRQRCPQHRREQLVVSLERSDPAPTVAGCAALRRPADRPLHSHPLSAPRHQ